MSEEEEAKSASATLRAVVRHLDGQRVEDKVILGSLRDVGVKYAHEVASKRSLVEGEPSTSTPWTFIRVQLPFDPRFVISLQRRRYADDEPATFQGVFSGTVAPLDIVSRLFDRATCEQLGSLGDEVVIGLARFNPGATAETLSDGSTGRSEYLYIRFRGWLEDDARAIAAIETLVSVVERIPDAITAADASFAANRAASPYRDASADRVDVAVVRRDEIEQAKEIIVKRKRSAVWRGVASVVTDPLHLVAAMARGVRVLFLRRFRR